MPRHREPPFVDQSQSLNLVFDLDSGSPVSVAVAASRADPLVCSGHKEGSLRRDSCAHAYA
ncbi:hypothetical protein ACIBF5_31190 [Micromonospora sp. NPDC050417]|uniref:hypothetical protein n=1 Tax=Micromonospora sp. NPDC050417 TaxID=3364280 RepID=UPI00379021CB